MKKIILAAFVMSLSLTSLNVIANNTVELTENVVIKKDKKKKKGSAKSKACGTESGTTGTTGTPAKSCCSSKAATSGCGGASKAKPVN
jgi:hypothetical protein